MLEMGDYKLFEIIGSKTSVDQNQCYENVRPADFFGKYLGSGRYL